MTITTFASSHNPLTLLPPLLFLSVSALLLLLPLQPVHAQCNTYNARTTSITEEETEGPYWVDEKLQRSNITEGMPGTPLVLTLTVLNRTGLESALCNATTFPTILPAYYAQVDMWHASAGGLYSDEASENTLGYTYFRGYQVTNSSLGGVVTFRTVMPGWYSGRTVHIHLRLRIFSSVDGSSVYNDTTQLFFNDTLTDNILAANSAYARSSTRDTYNTNDGIFNQDLLVTLSSDASTTNTGGYVGNFNLYFPFVQGSSTNPNYTSSPSDSTSLDTALIVVIVVLVVIAGFVAVLCVRQRGICVIQETPAKSTTAEIPLPRKRGPHFEEEEEPI